MTSPWKCSRIASTPAAVRALLGVDRERPGDDEAGVAGPPRGLVGREGLVLAADRDRPQRQHVGRVEPLQVGGHEEGLLDRQERREDAGHDPAVLGDPRQPPVDRVERLVDRRRAGGHPARRTYIAASRLGSLAAL